MSKELKDPKGFDVNLNIWARLLVPVISLAFGFWASYNVLQYKVEHNEKKIESIFLGVNKANEKVWMEFDNCNRERKELSDRIYKVSTVVSTIKIRQEDLQCDVNNLKRKQKKED